MATSSENLTEIGLVFSEEGYDSLIDKVKKVGQEVERLTKEENARVEAAAKVAKATATLSDQIDRNIASYAGSKSAILEYKAAQVGATEALAGQLAMLREMEEHTRQQAGAFKDRQQDLRNDRGLMEDYGRDQVAQSKALQAQQAEAAKMAKALEADRVKDIQLAVAAENKAREDATDRYVKSIKESFKQYQQVKANSIKVDEDVMAALRKANAEAEKLAERQAIKEIEWANKSAKERIAILQQVQQYQANPNISAETVANKFGTAAVKELPQLAAMQAAYTKEVHATEAAHGKQKESLKTMAEMWDHVTFNTSRARSEMIVIAHEAVQGRFSRIPASMMVFAEYTDLAALATTKLGLAVLGTIGAVATLTMYAVKGALEFTRINTALVQTGGFSAMTTANFYSMAAAITKAHGNIGEAKEALTLLAESGRFTREQISLIAPAIVDMAHVSGQSVEELVKQFEKIAKNPVAASKELNEQYHYLTGAIYEQIVALTSQGRKQEAIELAEKEFANASKDRADQIRSQLGWFERGWNAVERAVSKAVSAAKSLGRKDNIQDQLADAIEGRDALLNTSRGAGRTAGAVNTEKVKEYNALIFKLMRQSEQQEFDAQEKAAKKLIEQDDIYARERLKVTEKSMWSQEQRRQDAAAKIFQDAARVNAGALLAAGVKVYDVEKANAAKALAPNADLGAILEASKERNDKIIALAKERGVKLVITEERISKDLRNIEERRRDRPVQEVSFVELDKFIQDQERTLQRTQRHGDKMVAEQAKQYTADKRLADEALSVAKDNANTKNELKLAEVGVYSTYVQTVKGLNEKLLKEQKEALDEEVRIGQARTDAIIKRATAQVALTPDGKTKKAAVIERAKDDQTALMEARADRMSQLEAQANSNVLEAEAQSYRQALADANRLIDAVDKRLVQREREYAAIGLSKVRIRELAELEEVENARKIQAAIAQETLAMNAEGISQKEIAMYKERIAKLEELYTKTLRFVELNQLLKERQEDWQAGMMEGFHNYLDTVDNTFQSARKLTEQTFKGMEDALSGFVMTGKLNFANLFSTLGAGLARLYIQSKLLGPIADVLNGKKSSGGNDFIGNAIGSVGKFFGFGGSSSSNAGSNIAPVWDLGFGGAFAAGGNPPIGKPYLVGENGPEWHIDRTPSTILPNGQAPAGMGQQVTVVNHFVLQQPADQRTQDQIAVKAGESIQRAMARNR